MSIMIENQGMIQRMQDFSIIKQNEDIKPVVDQANLQNQEDKRIDNKSSQVQSGDDSSKSENRADAREKGSNEYSGDGGARRNKARQEKKDGVYLKDGVKHFDFSV